MNAALSKNVSMYAKLPREMVQELANAANNLLVALNLSSAF